MIFYDETYLKKASVLKTDAFLFSKLIVIINVNLSFLPLKRTCYI